MPVGRDVHGGMARQGFALVDLLAVIAGSHAPAPVAAQAHGHPELAVAVGESIDGIFALLGRVGVKNTGQGAMPCFPYALLCPETSDTWKEISGGYPQSFCQAQDVMIPAVLHQSHLRILAGFFALLKVEVDPRKA